MITNPTINPKASFVWTKRKTVSLFLTVSLLCSLFFITGAAYAESIGDQKYPTAYNSGGPSGAYDYLVFTFENASGTFYAVKDSFGRIIDSWTSTNASYTFGQANDALTSGRSWKENILLIGNFEVNAPLNVLNFTSVEVKGNIKIADDVNVGRGIFTVFNGNNIDIKGGTLDCNRAGTPDGAVHSYQSAVYVEKGFQVTIEGVYAKNGHYMGLSLYAMRNCTVKGNTVEDFKEEHIDIDHGLDTVNAGYNLITENHIYAGSTAGTNCYGIFIDGNVDYPSNRGNIITDNFIYGNKVLLGGILLSGLNTSGNTVANNFITQVNNPAILATSSYNDIIGNTIMLNEVAGIQIQANHNNVVGNFLISNGQRTNENFWAIELRANYTQVSGNKIVNDVTISAVLQRGIRENGATVDYNTITGNDLTGYVGTKIAIVGVNTKVSNNPGYVTENSNNNTGTGSQQAIAHGCSFTPTYSQVILSERSTGGALAYQSAAPNATHIHITATNGKDYNWKIERTP